MTIEAAGVYSILGRFVSYTWKFFAGGIVVVTAFSSNFLDLKQPSLSVEITEIEQITSAQVDISAAPEFVNLRKLVGGSLAYRFIGGASVEEMQQVVQREKQSLYDQKQDLQRNKDVVNKLPRTPPKPDDKQVVERPLTSRLFEDENDVSHLPYDLAKKLTDDLEVRIQDREKLVAAAEGEVKSYSEGAAKSDAKIIVTAAISNAGDGATTLKPQALLRADLGQGNYLDIDLKISQRQYDGGSGEIKARGTSVLKFESQPLNRMAPSDRERFTNFFKNTSPTNLFVVDVRGGYHKSNTIPFAQGIYEQKIFDGLKAFASKHD